MNKYKKRTLSGMQLCAIVLWTFVVATPSGAQTSAGTTAKAQDGPPLFTVTHDATLNGDGTSGSPLGMTASPTVSGSLTVNGDIQAKAIISQSSSVSGLLKVDNGLQVNTAVGNAVQARGGDSSINSFPGSGVFGTGGTGNGGLGGGRGVTGVGGDSTTGRGGTGVAGEGGHGDNQSNPGEGVLGLGGFRSGTGVVGLGGNTDRSGGIGGTGLSAQGGLTFFNGDGGPGVKAVGGQGRGTGFSGGIGIIATGGFGESGADTGLAGRFEGDVVVTGRLIKGSGSFRIDHPLDPANKYLYHSFVESPDMMNIYNGNITTDANGDAVVQLPEYFGALNTDFRYQLTVIGTFAQSMVAEKIKDNQFRIKTTLPNVEVSWQVTGVRQDAYANKNRIPVEVDKPELERGFYLHPDAFNQLLGKSILVQHPEKAKPR